MDCKTDKVLLHLIDTTGPGGAETVFIQLADHLRRRGYRSLAVVRGEGWVADGLRRRGIETHVLAAKGSFALGFLLRLYWLARRERVDLIQSHLLGSNVYAALLGLLLRRPVVASYHGSVDVAPRERFRRLKMWVMRRGIQRYVAVSTALAGWIRRKGLLNPDRTEVIHNGVDPDNYRGEVEGWLRDRLRLPPESIIVGCLGNVRPAKAYDQLVDLAAMLAARRPTVHLPAVHLVVAGHRKASLMEPLERRMREKGVENLHFIGFVESSVQFLRQLDVFLLCSRSEGFSIATVEALMCGLPVAATRCGGPEEILEHRKTGLLVEVDDVAALNAAVNALLSDPTLARKLAREGRRRAVHRFGLEAMLDRYDRLYQSLLNPVALTAGADA